MVILSKLTFLGFYLSSILDKRKHKVNVKEIKEILDRGDNIIDYLKLDFGFPNIDLSIFTKEDSLELSKEFRDISLSINENKKMGIENDGIALLLGYTLELIQRTIKEKSKMN